MTWLRGMVSDPVLGRVIAIIIGITLATVAIRFARRAVNRYVEDADSRYRARKAVSVTGYVLVVFYLTLVFRDRLGGLTLAFGIIGAGIAFALQEVVASVAGWAALLFGRFYRVGDRIEVGSVRGDVIDIGVLRTTLMEVGQWVRGDLYSGRIVRMANSAVFKEPVFNYSADFPFLWDEIVVPIRFGSHREQTRAMLLQAAVEIVGSYVPTAKSAWTQMVNRYMVEAASVEPMVSLVVTDNWLEYTLRYVVDYRKRRSMRDALFRRILDAVDASSGTVTLASSTFEVVQVPPLRVDLQPSPRP
jgi:small-conductance mechanosensitive channel